MSMVATYSGDWQTSRLVEPALKSQVFVQDFNHLYLLVNCFDFLAKKLKLALIMVLKFNEIPSY